MKRHYSSIETLDWRNTPIEAQTVATYKKCWDTTKRESPVLVALAPPGEYNWTIHNAGWHFHWCVSEITILYRRENVHWRHCKILDFCSLRKKSGRVPQKLKPGVTTGTYATYVHKNFLSLRCKWSVSENKKFWNTKKIGKTRRPSYVRTDN